MLANLKESNMLLNPPKSSYPLFAPPPEGYSIIENYHLARSSDINLGSGVFDMTWNSFLEDPSGLLTGEESSVTAPVGTVFAIARVQTRDSASGSTYTEISMQKNTVEFARQRFHDMFYFSHMISAVVPCSAGDVFKCVSNCNSGGTTNIAGHSRFSVTFYG